MSPEQCEAKPDELDIRTDVYSLGVVLYELLCDQPPYDLSDTPLPKATRIIQEQEPPCLRLVKGGLRGDLEAIALKALAKRPEMRYQSAAGLARDVRHLLKGELTEARPPTTWARLVRWIGLHPIITTAVVCVAIAGLSIILTVGSIWLLGTRPHQIRLTPDRREARLVSMAGNILHTWESNGEGRIVFAELIDRPGRFGGDKIALIGREADTHLQLDGTLSAYLMSDLEAPIWSVRITDDDIRDSPLRPGFTEAQFQVTCAETIDVFPERPGEEIVVIHKDGPYSPVALRVYDLGGELLYQIWHDGPLNPGYWIAAEQIMVVCGLSHEAPWAQEYYEESGHRPIIVFGLTPKVGHISKRWTGVSPGADTATLVWYQCVMPPALAAGFGGAKPIRPHGGEDPIRSVRFNLFFGTDRENAVSWLMTPDGTLDPGTAVPTDKYRVALEEGHAPAPERLHLETLWPTPSAQD
jgi:hypothetical protein